MTFSPDCFFFFLTTDDLSPLLDFSFFFFCSRSPSTCVLTITFYSELTSVQDV